MRRLRDYCKRGHPMSGSNVRIRKDGRRDCKACQRFHKHLGRKTPAEPRFRNGVRALSPRDDGRPRQGLAELLERYEAIRSGLLAGPPRAVAQERLPFVEGRISDIRAALARVGPLHGQNRRTLEQAS